MFAFQARGILLDIEGTTSSIRFVHDVMFPYARRKLARYLRDHWGAAELDAALDLLAQDAGFQDRAVWLADLAADAARQQVVAHVFELMDADAKSTGLKHLQGLIWRGGFEGGQLRAHVYPDVVPVLRAWKQAGIDLRIFSSGSVDSQKLFFGHTGNGSILDLIDGHFDTRVGSKQDPASYRKIAEAFELPAASILFISDLSSELAAAHTAGMQVVMSVRPGNAPVGENYVGPSVESFSELQLIAS